MLSVPSSPHRRLCVGVCAVTHARSPLELLLTGRCCELPGAALTKPPCSPGATFLSDSLQKLSAVSPPGFQGELLFRCCTGDSTTPHGQRWFRLALKVGARVSAGWGIRCISGDYNFNMQTVQVVMSSSRAVYQRESVTSAEASNHECYFKNTAHNSAATFWVCILKLTES